MANRPVQVPVNVPILGQKPQSQQINPAMLFQMLVEGLGQVIMRLDRVIMLMEKDLPENEKTVRLVDPKTQSGSTRDDDDDPARV